MVAAVLCGCAKLDIPPARATKTEPIPAVFTRDWEEGVYNNYLWVQIPEDVAARLIGANKREEGEPPKYHTFYRSTGLVVLVHEEYQDDSVHRGFHQIRMEWKNGAWYPIEHKTSFQGRGPNGWSSGPFR